MLERIYVYNSETASDECNFSKDAFILKTCQRFLVVQYRPIECSGLPGDMFQGNEGIRFLIETLCGLKSSLLGENEIIGQFKVELQKYKTSKNKSSLIIKSLEKVFTDTKLIRSTHLHGVGQLSYSGITKKILLDKKLENKDVVIIGSGKLAEALVKVLKRRFNLKISARNSDKVECLKTTYEIEELAFLDVDLLKKETIIINTVGRDEPLWENSFIDNWLSDDERILVDLSNPSPINTKLSTLNGVFRLNDIFELSKRDSIAKYQAIADARKAIDSLLLDKKSVLSINLPFGWEELSFA